MELKINRYWRWRNGKCTVNEFCFNFYDIQPKNVEEARALIVECAEIALNLVNKDEKIRPYLPIPRMQGKNLKLQLVFDHTPHSQLKVGDFEYIDLYTKGVSKIGLLEI